MEQVWGPCLLGMKPLLLTLSLLFIWGDICVCAVEHNGVQLCFPKQSLRILFFSSVYQIVVEEERPRRTKKTTEILKCYPVPIHFQNASILNSQYYFAAEFPANSLQVAQPFTIGDNKTYNGYWNTPLLPHKSYRIYFQAASRANGVSFINGCLLRLFRIINANAVKSHIVVVRREVMLLCVFTWDKCILFSLLKNYFHLEKFLGRSNYIRIWKNILSTGWFLFSVFTCYQKLASNSA